MSTSIADARPVAPPYTVLLEVTNIRKDPGNFVVGVMPYVDLRLTAEQRHLLTDVKARMKVNAAAVFERIFIMVGALVGLIGATMALQYANYPLFTGFLVGGAAVLCVGVAMIRHVRAAKSDLDALVTKLIDTGAMTPAPLDEAKKADLARIQACLTMLHKRGDTSRDDQARAAAEMVLAQDRHRPTLKHIAIADSDGKDPATQKIRKLVKEQRRAWNEDTAAAELAIEELRALAVAARRSAKV